MTTETEVGLNQHFSVAPTPEQLKILTAKKLLENAKYYVNRGCIERDFAAYPLMAEIEKFLKDA